MGQTQSFPETDMVGVSHRLGKNLKNQLLS